MNRLEQGTRDEVLGYATASFLLFDRYSIEWPRLQQKADLEEQQQTDQQQQSQQNENESDGDDDDDKKPTPEEKDAQNKKGHKD